MTADFEGQCRTIWVADIDLLTVLDIDARHSTVVDEKAVETTVVDGDPSALVEPEHQVRTGNKGVSNADIRSQVTSDDYIVACCEGAFRSVVTHSQNRWGCLAH